MRQYAFNSETKYVLPSWYCNQTSKNFTKFVTDFIDLNGNSIRYFNSLKKRNVSIRSDKSNFIRSIQDLLNSMDLFKFLVGENYSYDAQQNYKSYKFPIISNSNHEILDNFLKNKKEIKRNKNYFTFDDLEDFYMLCLDAEYMREDIYEMQLKVHYEDIEFIEYKYNIKYDFNFPRDTERKGVDLFTFLKNEFYKTHASFIEEINDVDDIDIEINQYLNNYIDNRLIKYEMDNDGFIACKYYSRRYAIILNYLSYLYSEKCENFHYLENIGEKHYILSSIFTLIYNSMNNPIAREIIHSPGYRLFRKTVSNKLNEITVNPHAEPMNCNWLGINRYYDILGIMPKILYDINIPEEHYLIRVNSYFSDKIKGSPLASHGWMAEAIEQLENDGVF